MHTTDLYRFDWKKQWSWSYSRAARLPLNETCAATELLETFHSQASCSSSGALQLQAAARVPRCDRLLHTFSWLEQPADSTWTAPVACDWDLVGGSSGAAPEEHRMYSKRLNRMRGKFTEGGYRNWLSVRNRSEVGKRSASTWTLDATVTMRQCKNDNSDNKSL